MELNRNITKKKQLPVILFMALAVVVMGFVCLFACPLTVYFMLLIGTERLQSWQVPATTAATDMR